MTGSLDCLLKRTEIRTKEVQIARFCFANPPADAKETIGIRKAFRRNFVKRKDDALPRSAGELLHISFNGANDLTLLTSADTIDGEEEDGVVHECWVATTDDKLAKFADHFHLVNIQGGSTPFAAVTMHPEHTTDSYWDKTVELWQRATERDVPKPDRPREVDDLRAMARRAAAAAEAAFLATAT